MREIRFRLWDNRTKKMCEVSSITFYDNTAWIDAGDSDVYGKLMTAISFDDCELMQYTGLKDKNGVEVYEGDIYHQGDKNILYVVVWHDTSFIGKQLKSSSYAGLTYWLDRIEIIGNIHDNPELISSQQR